MRCSRYFLILFLFAKNVSPAKKVLQKFGWDEIKRYLCKRNKENSLNANGSLAQLNRASDYGSEGYRFESYRSHKETFKVSFFLCQPCALIQPEGQGTMFIVIAAMASALLLRAVRSKLQSGVKPNGRFG